MHGADEIVTGSPQNSAYMYRTYTSKYTMIMSIMMHVHYDACYEVMEFSSHDCAGYGYCSKRESLEAQGPTLCFFCLDDLDKKSIGML